MSILTKEDITLLRILRRKEAKKPRAIRLTTRDFAEVFGVSVSAISYHSRLRSQPRRT